MKLSHVKQKLANKEPMIFDVMANPSELSEWIVWIREPSGKSHLLVNEDEVVFRSKDANDILTLLKGLGVKKLQISL